jgi:hypothetical protein
MLTCRKVLSLSLASSGAPLLDHQLAHLVACLQRVHPLALQRPARRVATGGCQAARQGFDGRGDGPGGLLARLFHVLRPHRPQAAVQGRVGLHCLGRRAVGGVGLAGVLVLAGADHVGRDAHAVEQVLVVVAIAAIAFDQYAAHGVQPDLVGAGRQVVMALLEVRTPGVDGLARGLEALDRRADLAQRGQAGAAKTVQHQERVARCSRPWLRRPARPARRAGGSGRCLRPAVVGGHCRARCRCAAPPPGRPGPAPGPSWASAPARRA